MPKKAKAKKNSKNNNITVEKRKLIEAEIEGQVYGIAEKALGARFFTVNCVDNISRRCKVRKKRMKVKVGDCCIISLRDFDNNNADIVYRYNTEEVRQLQKDGVLPNSNDFAFKGDDEVDDDDVFIFEEI